MLKHTFKKAIKIYPQDFQNQMNVSLFFVVEVHLETKGFLWITGNNGYRIYQKDNIIGYGPARAAHQCYRIDRFKLKPGFNRLVIELSAYGCNSYYYLNTTPFLQAEITCDDIVVAYTGENFTCYQNTTRYQKVTRFSYQRTFAEAYHFKEDLSLFLLGKSQPFSKVATQPVVEEVTYLPRRVAYPTLKSVPFIYVESGTITTDSTLPIYDDRYMHLSELGIFDKTIWEIDANKTISQLKYNVETQSKNRVLSEKTFATYKYFSSKTGFIRWAFTCHEDAIVHIIFDEINLATPPEVQISFSRNTTHNILSYELKAGAHSHISFEPYTAQFIRVIVIKGSITIRNIGMMLFENPEVRIFKYSFSHRKIQKIMDAAVTTFAQNAVDILTDCPSRERAGWLCDSYFTSQAERFFTGDNKVERNFLENYALAKPYPTLPNGMIPMCYPGEFPDGNFIPNWAMFYALELDNLASRTRDKSISNISKDKIEGLLTYFSAYENEIGLLENLQGWIFVEWSKANDNEYIQGVNTPSNMLYAAFLEAASHILECHDYAIKADKIRSNIKKLAYNGMFFVDNLLRDKDGTLTQTTHISEVCQYYAFYFKVASQKEYPELYQTLLTAFGPHRDDKNTYANVAKANVFIGNYLRLAILHAHHEYEQVLNETVDYFYGMAIRTGTLWEHDSPHASLNHGFASYIAILITYCLCGIDTIDYVHKVIYYRDVKQTSSFNISIPLKEGKINIYNCHGQLTIEAPSNYRVIKQ